MIASRPPGPRGPALCHLPSHRRLHVILEGETHDRASVHNDHSGAARTASHPTSNPSINGGSVRVAPDVGDDYVIENDRGERVFKVDGKALRVRKTLLFEDMQGRELCKIQERMLRVKDSMEIEDSGGRRVAMVKKDMITPLRERWVVKVEDGPDLHVQGNIVDHENTIERDGDKVAELSKRWFRVPDTYGVEVAPDENDILILATTGVIDEMAHPDR